MLSLQDFMYVMQNLDCLDIQGREIDPIQVGIIARAPFTMTGDC